VTVVITLFFPVARGGDENSGEDTDRQTMDAIDAPDTMHTDRHTVGAFVCVSVRVWYAKPGLAGQMDRFNWARGVRINRYIQVSQVQCNVSVPSRYAVCLSALTESSIPFISSSVEPYTPHSDRQRKETPRTPTYIAIHT